MMFAPQGAPQLSLSGEGASNGSTEFTVGPSGGVFLVGNHAVVIPANGICDPASSSYGPSTWDDPCIVLASDLTIHAVARSEKGRNWVDFTPALRFVPSHKPAAWAYIYMFTPGAKHSRDLSAYNILYSTEIGAAGIDESLHDATLRTYVDKKSGTSMRRIKHFSGYNSWGLVSCDPVTEPGCTDTPVDSLP